MRKIIICLLIVAGIATFFYPHATGIYWEYRMNRDLEAFASRTANLSQEESSSIEVEYDAGAFNTVGILKISQISLEIPVYYGTSTSSLRQGAGLLESGGLPGGEGNTVITAHRAHSHGRLFNRLDELEIGDVATITTANNVFKYEINSTQIYEKEDTSYLSTKEDGGEKLILITCHPFYQPNPPYRLVVEATRIH